MKRKSFLVGNFLPAYHDAFHHPRTPRPAKPSHTPEQLATHFARRAARYKARNRSYRMGIQTSLALSLLVMIGMVHLPLQPDAPVSFAVATQEVIQMDEIIQTVQYEKPPPPPRPPVPVEVPDDVLLPDDPLALDAGFDLSQPLAALPPPPPPPVAEAADEEPEVFVAVEEVPELIGGLAQLYAALAYPPLAQKAGIEGLVVVQVIVDEEGQPIEPKVLKTAHEMLNDAAIEAVLQQRFKPGRQRGRAVRTQMAVPVDFRLTR